MRSQNMTSFIVMDIVREAKKYEDSIHFEIGQPDLPPSTRVKKALHVAIDEDRFSYTESHGLYELREKIAKHYHDTYKVKVEPSQIFLTPGTSGAFLIAYGLTLKHASSLGLSDPSYPCYKNFAHMMDIKPVFMPIGKEDKYQLHVKDLKQHTLDAVQISSPANPTGNIYESENLKEIIEYCDKQNVSFISDELYHGLTYESDAHCALEYSSNVYVINGFSKFFCMPGSRLGWIIVPKEKVRAAEKIAQNLFISAPTLSQYGALEAFDKKHLEEVKEEFKKRRDYLFTELGQVFEIDAKPQGAFYLWANVSKYTDDSFEFAKELLENIHVATTPGVDFGSNHTEQYLRFAYTRDITHMREGIERLKKYLKA
ncbi:aminotransferase class I/II-fold pyridoxal phosphate-dependent enzyme [Sulfurospirillum arcachonense]|uniref:aminotransferase class I/II-fold pyridoxal phosphate-dependent enzyme n=1 Tax=Sulfurospirillum arcachonense TaxID=57666 RepID=UPI000468724C|nr:aminotransferase class I/II-fold pyridoxal phosphate-dependent enzyme [Sulfurospirillum arcachonense]